MINKIDKLVDKPKSLYGLEKEYYELMLAIEENEGEITDDIAQQLEINQENLESKLKGYSYFINKLKSEQLAIKDERERLTNLSNVKENVINRLKLSIRNALELFGNTGKSGNKILEFDTIKLYTRKNEVVYIADPDGFSNPNYTVKTITNKLKHDDFLKILSLMKEELNIDEVKWNRDIRLKDIKADLKGGVTIDGAILKRDDNVIIK